MRSVQEALNEILSAFQVGKPEIVPLLAALGRPLAEAVTAQNDLPLFDNSSMDGYAVRAEDVASVPVTLHVLGEIPAGTEPTLRVGQGQAARIMTGAVVPDGADAIVPIEQVREIGEGSVPAHVEILQGSSRGAYIRPRGEDVKTGESLLEKGHLLRPQDLGLLAGLGIARVLVIQKPRVAVLSTGDELLAPDAPIEAGKIRDMNSFSIPAMVMSLGAEPLLLGVAQDTEESVHEKLMQAVELGADLILSSAGVSVGTHDVVKTVMEQLGAIGFWRVNMRPGKPLAYGQVQGIPFLGLPGNPVSSLVSFEIFARPAILKMLGQSPAVPEIEVAVGEAITSDGRESYIRVRLQRANDGQMLAFETGTQSSGAISSLVKADALLVIPSGMKAVKIGDKLKVRPFAGASLFFR